jgi:hypothetical protein
MNNLRLGDWEFQKLGLRDYQIYSDYIKLSDCPTSRFSSNFVYLWANSHRKGIQVLWKIVDGMLATFVITHDNTLYLMCIPFGKGDAEKVVQVLLKCVGFCYKWNKYNRQRTTIDTINGEQLDFLSASPLFHQYFQPKKLEGQEIFFGIQNLLTLAGKEFKLVRQKINRFHNKYPQAVIRKVRSDDSEQLLQLKREWNQQKGHPVADDIPFRAVLAHHQQMEHILLVAEVDAKIVGMISGGPLPNGLSWVYFQKALHDYTGLSEVLYVELAKEINKVNPEVKLMNVGSDYGGGLKAFKDKFRPVLSLDRYTVIPNR